MEIAQVNDRQEVGTIQSVESFTPPFTAIAAVKGTISNGHTFGFAISSTNASSGVDIYGNLNDTNCSNLGDCGNPAVCGNTANPLVTPANQCYYGIEAKYAQSGGNWGNKTKLYLTPSENVTYTLLISVDASGSASFGVSQGGQALGRAGTAQVGTGPFYIILDQGEGSPVGNGRGNQAYWMSVMMTSSASTITTSSSSVTGPPPSTSTAEWMVIVIVAAVMILILILLYYRRGGFTVTVLDSQTRSTIIEARVSADGPKNLAGVTGKDGKVAFGKVKEGDYSVQAAARGYNTSSPAIVHVKRKTEYSIGLDRTAPAPPAGLAANAPSVGPSQSPVPQQPPVAVTPPSQQGVAPAMAKAESAPAPTAQQEKEEQEGGGGRVGQIIKKFQEKGAVSPETALTAEELGLSRMFVRIMKRRKGKTRIFIEINGKYYLDQKALQETS